MMARDSRRDFLALILKPAQIGARRSTALSGGSRIGALLIEVLALCFGIAAKACEDRDRLFDSFLRRSAHGFGGFGFSQSFRAALFQLATFLLQPIKIVDDDTRVTFGALDVMPQSLRVHFTRHHFAFF